MKKIDAILLCYGTNALKQKIEIKIKQIVYTSWMIEGINTKEELMKMYTKRQIITIYESGI
ncbi:hypothetical protein [Aliarcobacter butzleri]|uniref:hypothetical protein n=1 Tax=Aliarcobacter butzleri TaxID=28197 RepID=UPI002B24B3EF|nr:hypothetical protein [Aliarcobacter butzleri]MCG3717673.1 hypothetical protein [Aliarcobacter butzleri]